MVIAPLVFFGLVGIIVALFVVCVYLAYFAKKPDVSSQDERVQKVLVAAEREAEEIVKSSVEKAQETLLDAQYVKDDLMRSIDSSMRSIAESAVVSFQEESQKTHTQFKELFAEIAREYKKETEKTVASLEKEAQNEAETFREELKQEIIVSQRKADERAEQAYVSMKQELEEYKQQKIHAIDTQIQGMVGKVFADVLGRSLTSSEHEKLVMDALAEAKKNGVLSFLHDDLPEQASDARESNGKLGATGYKPLEEKETHHPI